MSSLEAISKRGDKQGKGLMNQPPRLHQHFSRATVIAGAVNGHSFFRGKNFQ